MGNLMLDMVAPVEEEYLEKFGLLPDTTQMAEERHDKLYDEISNSPSVKFSPGGSALNTARMVQRILNVSNGVTMIGAVGSDDLGKYLVDIVEKEGIKMLVQIVDKGQTAKCASLLTNGGSARTMVTELGAATKFSHEMFVNSEDLKWLEGAKFIYVSGYFIKVSFETVMNAVQHAKRGNVPVFLNLNAVWVTTVFTKELLAILPFVDVLFGNDSEASSFAKQLGFESESLMDFAMRLSRFEQCNLQRPTRLVIITRGENPILCADGSKSQEFPVQPLRKEELVDSTGAGDAFVGGFMASYIRNKCLEDCIACGKWAATEELKGFGFNLPMVPPQFQFLQS